MSNSDAELASLRFDEGKSFSENCAAFLSVLDKVDADMAVILRNNWGALIEIVRDGERDSKARAEFNSKVLSALDSLIKTADPEGKA